MNLTTVPAWVLEKKYGRTSMTTAAAILALQAGTAAVKKETANAVLIEWDNTQLNTGAIGGEFWCPKSVLK